VAALVYTATWTDWFRSEDAYFRHWVENNPAAGWGWVPDPLRSLAHYHLEAYKFHQGLGSEHPYEASAWSWLVMGRPTSFYYQQPGPESPECAAARCASAILSVGNPKIWWSAAISLVVLLFWWAGRRDWRAGAVLAGVGAGYLPWFLYPERTMFFFYAVSFEPFLILALVYCLGLVLGREGDPLWRRRSGLYLLALFVAAALLLSAFFYPLWTAETISYDEWRSRMWMPSWI
jgi:dolichyl-phosphate-mannose-protein mannosyltransferase